MSIQSEVTMEVLEELTKAAESKEGGSGMALIAMSMHSLMTIQMYEAKMEEKMGPIVGLFKAIEEGNFSDENGSALTDTLTFQNLKKRLITAGE